jgi:hypothetical protein
LELPADLLKSVVDPAGGKVTIVIGAGCSKEMPTNLPLSRELAIEAFGRLEADGILESMDCPDATDLSAVASAVFRKSGSQEELVARLPRMAFRNAKPNDGYLIAAALLREQVMKDLLNLNFDHGAMHALAEVNVKDRVNIVTGPEEHDHMGTNNVVYLHRDAAAPADSWILRKEQLEEEWKDAWQEVVVSRVLASPVVVFVGLGSPAAVLVETCSRIRKAVPGQKIYWVDPGPGEGSPFAKALDLEASAHIQMGWSEFMTAVSERVTMDQVAGINAAIDSLCDREQLEQQDCEMVLLGMQRLGILGLGTLRGAWLLAQPGYFAVRELNQELLGDLVLATALIQSELECEVDVKPNGNLELRKAANVKGSLVPVSGGGVRSMATIEAALRERLSDRRPYEPCVVLASAVSEQSSPIAPPDDLLASSREDDIVTPHTHPVFATVTQLRADPSNIIEALG